MHKFLVSAVAVGGGACWGYQNPQSYPGKVCGSLIGETMRFQLLRMKKFESISGVSKPTLNQIRDGSNLSQQSLLMIKQHFVQRFSVPIDADEFNYYTKKLNVNSTLHKLYSAHSNLNLIGVSINQPQNFDRDRMYAGACMAMSCYFIKERVSGLSTKDIVGQFRTGYPNHFARLNDDLYGFRRSQFSTGKILIDDSYLKPYGLKITEQIELLHIRNRDTFLDNIKGLKPGTYLCSNYTFTGHNHVIVMEIQDDSLTVYDPNFGAVWFSMEDSLESFYEVVSSQLQFEKCASFSILRAERITETRA